MPSRRSELALLLAATLVGSLLTLSPAGAERIVAVGDIHGAYEPLLAILQQTSLVDEEGRWVGGESVLVQTGDFLDRGAGSGQVLELLKRLQEEAPAAGGEVVVLLGNHEVLNLVGEMKDVTPEIVGPFAGARSEARHRELCRDWLEIRRRQSRRFEGFDLRDRRVERSLCMSENPVGMIEYFAALAPDSAYGSWLRTLPAAVRFGDLVFVHGGFSLVVADEGLESVNRKVAAEIAAFDQAREALLEEGLILPTARFKEVLRLARAIAAGGRRSKAPIVSQVKPLLDAGDWLLLRQDGPFWFRGYARWDEEEGDREIGPILETLGASHLVVGHTPQRPRSIRTRFAGRVFLIDTGMLGSVYRGGRPSALEIEDGRFRAVYLDHEQSFEVIEERKESEVSAGVEE